jgi:hypothetical protein
LGIEDIPEYDPAEDPTRNGSDNSWNYHAPSMKDFEKTYKERISKNKKKLEDTKDVCKKKRKIE